MSSAIKISSKLAETARAAATDNDRSLTGQVEHWARLGKAVEPLLDSRAVAALKKYDGHLDKIEETAEKARLLNLLDQLRTDPPYATATAALAAPGHPLYEADPTDPEGIVQILPDGTRRNGRLIERTFVPNKNL
ncbi:MAG: hypothetical protein JJU00_12230 [Opitutales bacterium]|nr:hypothetical protein [Opitutales bacterium]